MAVITAGLRQRLKRVRGLHSLWQWLCNARNYATWVWLTLWLPQKLRFHTAPPPGLVAPVVVSLTSHPPRFKFLALTLRCLLCQTIRPDHLVLWIAREDKALLPASVLALQKHGLEIGFVEDMKSYKKLIPALQTYGFDINHVIVDDDMFQAPTWLETLLRDDGGEEDGEAGTENVVHCHFGRIWLEEGAISACSGQFPKIPTYRQWPPMSPGSQTPHGFLIGHGGVWFPPGSLGPESCDYALAAQLCPLQDDVWFTWHVLMRGWQIRRVSQPSRRFSWPGADAGNMALSSQNNPEGGGNDLAMRRIILHYGMPSKR